MLAVISIPNQHAAYLCSREQAAQAKQQAKPREARQRDQKGRRTRRRNKTESSFARDATKLSFDSRKRIVEDFVNDLRLQSRSFGLASRPAGDSRQRVLPNLICIVSARLLIAKMIALLFQNAIVFTAFSCLPNNASTRA